MDWNSEDLPTLRTREGLAYERLQRILDVVPRIKVIVLGDYFLDKYLVTDPLLSERSVETGLEARQVVSIRTSPGAAGTVTNNLAALGAGEIHAVGVIGEEGEGHDLRRGLAETGVATAHLYPATGRFTPTYVKPMVADAFGETELERLDIKNRAALSAELESTVIAGMESLLSQKWAGGPTALIVADQVEERNCGVVTDSVRSAICELAARFPDVVMFADSRARVGEFRQVYVKPNKTEAARATALRSEVGLIAWEAAEVARKLHERTGKPVFLTMGEDGIIVAETERATHVLAMRAPSEIDIVGAGDSATAGIVSALCAGCTPVEAAAMGNLCAAVTIRKLGATGTASAAELRSAWKEY